MSVAYRRVWFWEFKPPPWTFFSVIFNNCLHSVTINIDRSVPFNINQSIKYPNYENVILYTGNYTGNYIFYNTGDHIAIVYYRIEERISVI